MAILELKDVSFSYGDLKVLEKINLSLNEGDFLGILGPNGAGKSTLMKIMSGALKPREGLVLFEGKEISSVNRRELARKIAFVPQQMPFDFPFTGKEFVMMGRFPYTGILGIESAEDEKIVEKVMKLSDTAGLSSRLVNMVSGGERQRLIIAQALAQDSGTILLDEPTAHLDIKHQVQILDILRKMNREKNITAASALHDLNLSAAYCEKLLFLKDGKIFAEGTPAGVFKKEIIEEVFETPVEVLPASEERIQAVVLLSAKE
ncbi:MAG: ABC transporter ATP-binding protein [Firmicutes bacterium]|nr:ABC transporter ATP-binding protein [Bacillota bacterium]